MACYLGELNRNRAQWRRQKSSVESRYIKWERGRKIPHKPYIARNYNYWPTFLPLIVWVYLHSNFCGGLRRTHLFCNRERIGRWFWHTNRKSAYATSYGNFGPILHRFRDTATYWLKIALFFYPTPVLLSRTDFSRTRTWGPRTRTRIKISNVEAPVK